MQGEGSERSEAGSPKGGITVGTPKQMVDAYLGDGMYDGWQDLDKQERDAEREFFLYRGQLRLSLSSPLVQRISQDYDVVRRIAGDYSNALKLVSLGRRPSKEKIGQVFTLYTLALIIVDNQNEMLDAMFATGFAGALIVFPIMLLQAQANQMLDALEELQKELEKAEHEVKNAHNKRAFHLAVTFFQAMFPEISLAARGSIFLGGVIVDEALGPPDATTADKTKGIATSEIEQFSEAIHHIPELGEKARGVAEKMGKAATLATFYFDYEEISEGEERVEKLKELTEKVKRGYDGLTKVLDDNKVKIQQFLLAFERWMKAIEGIRTGTDGYRQRLSDDMDEFGYSVRQVVSWPDAA